MILREALLLRARFCKSENSPLKHDVILGAPQAFTQEGNTGWVI
jgi:hypothetical protein